MASYLLCSVCLPHVVRWIKMQTAEVQVLHCTDLVVSAHAPVLTTCPVACFERGDGTAVLLFVSRSRL